MNVRSERTWVPLPCDDQCDQMDIVSDQYLAIYTNKSIPNSIGVCQILLYILPNTEYTLNQIVRDFEFLVKVAKFRQIWSQWFTCTCVVPSTSIHDGHLVCKISKLSLPQSSAPVRRTIYKLRQINTKNNIKHITFWIWTKLVIGGRLYVVGNR